MTRQAETPTGSDVVIHPSCYVVDELEDRGWSCEQLALRIGRKPKALARVLQGRAPITGPLAKDLQEALGLSAKVLRELQLGYNAAIERLAEERAVQADVARLEEIPWRDIARKGWIRDLGTDVERISELRSFFDVESIADIESTKHAAAFRISRGTSVDAWALAAWLQEGEWQALDRQLDRQGSGDSEIYPHFDLETFQANLSRIRALSLRSSFWLEMRKLCASAGVALEFVPNVPKSGANGVTHWLEGERPLIQLSLFRKRADIFWFTFFHEAGHLVLHEPEDFLINLDERNAADNRETEADQFAADILIPPARYQSFADAGRFDEESILGFAESIEIHPGIVVGRLQNDQHLMRNWQNNLRVSYNEVLFSG